MAFLDNSGDIILDAVLTDTGRYRLAKGDGSFRIVKFALGDDEINYSVYDKNHPSGSAYFDLEVLRTPILEAFTNNASSLKSKLISIPRNNLLYLPVLRLNELRFKRYAQSTPTFSDVFVVSVDEDTEEAVFTATGNLKGILRGARPGSDNVEIWVDQGLDTEAISPATALDSDLVETQYIVELDNRFMNLVDTNGNQARVSFIDDDNIASYFLSLGTDQEYVSENNSTDVDPLEVISGPRGTSLKFRLQSSIELNTSEFLFDQLGSTTTIGSPPVNVKFIDSIVRVTGATTGYRIDIPVRLVKAV